MPLGPTVSICWLLWMPQMGLSPAIRTNGIGPFGSYQWTGIKHRPSFSATPLSPPLRDSPALRKTWHEAFVLHTCNACTPRLMQVEGGLSLEMPSYVGSRLFVHG
ncbi:hypothetical protein BDV23DRAFT_161392 [Aspergillus alliaceus]|uniref:Uncharacterized protein n=1 Tax=Petromyces alliaceus TaxID=209559 RepID=A0A5N6G7H8_PETAA|nr:uncharacterized protein BDW43DRAFT_261414 [Aspergillus alliaceus]KAB8238346.1 hypothetical protein BDW43DRAFT_261414 [Aspergillus alliaceus]KAE8387286.1 hypothetical protein BDV23DRAFT_161392 [Aspergillus alliaceus]